MVILLLSSFCAKCRLLRYISRIFDFCVARKQDLNLEEITAVNLTQHGNSLYYGVVSRTTNQTHLNNFI